MPDIDDIFGDEEDVAKFTKTKLAATMPVQAPIMRNVRPVPVAGWPKVAGERVLLWVVHPNAKFCTGKDREEWQCWCAGYWTERSKSWPHGHDKGWVWNGMMGHITHVAPLPPAPEGA